MEEFNAPQIRTIRDYTIVNVNVGLHYGLIVMSSAHIAKESNKYTGDVFIKNVDKNSRRVNAKSVLSLMTLEASKGTKLRIYVKGTDLEARTFVQRLYSGISTEGPEDDSYYMNFDRFTTK